MAESWETIELDHVPDPDPDHDHDHVLDHDPFVESDDEATPPRPLAHSESCDGVEPVGSYGWGVAG